MRTTKAILLKGVCIPKLLNNLLPSCYFDTGSIISFIDLTALGFLLSVVFFYTLKCNTITLFYKQTKIFDEMFQSLFVLSLF